MEGILAPWHIAIVLVIALLVFGPKKLPQMGHSLGKSISGFRQGMKEASEEFTGATKEVQETSPTAEAVPVSQPSEPVVVSAGMSEPAAMDPNLAEPGEAAAKV